MKKSRSPCHNSSLLVHSRSPLRYRCNTCKRTYVARHGQISFGSKLSPNEILHLLKLFKEGLSIRKIAQITHLSPSTVDRWKHRFLQQKLLNSFTPNSYERFQHPQQRRSLLALAQGFTGRRL